MENDSRKKIFVALSVIAVLAVLFLTVYFVGKRQDIRQHAAAGDAVTFTINPTTIAAGTSTFTATLALQGKGSDISAVDIIITSSDVNKLEITGFTPTTTYAQVGTTTLGSGSRLRYVGVNSAGTPIVGTGVDGEITLGTLSLTVKGSGGGALSVDPATVVTRGGGGGTTLAITNTTPLATYIVAATTVTAGVSLSPTGSTTLPTATSGPSTTPAAGSLQLKFNDNIKLQGISNNGQALGSPNAPVSQTKTFTVELYNAEGTKVGAGAGNIMYNPATKNFGTGTGVISVAPVGITVFPPGATYTVKVKTDRYLKKLLQGFLTIPSSGIDPCVDSAGHPVSSSICNQTIILLTGDISNENIISIQGYNALIDCGAADNPPLTNRVSEATTKYAACRTHAEILPKLDLNDDGYINMIDLGLLTSNLRTQHGD